ncbi:hypothetical protein [Francisella tularensis]|nr:hypothetical protein [Francisella tularensis]
MLEGWDIPTNDQKWIKYLTSTTSEKAPLNAIFDSWIWQVCDLLPN